MKDLPRLSETDKKMLEQYARYWPKLERLASWLIGRRLGQRLDAPDAVQEAYALMACEAATGCFPLPKPDVAELRLRRLVRRVILRASERYSTQKRDVRREEFLTGDWLPGRQSPQDEIAIVADQLALVDSELGRLPAVILIRRMAGSTLAQIAQQLGVPTSEVRRHLGRLRRYLRSMHPKMNRADRTDGAAGIHHAA